MSIYIVSYLYMNIYVIQLELRIRNCTFSFGRDEEPL